MLKFVLIAITHLATTDSWAVVDYDLTGEDCIQQLADRSESNPIQDAEYVCAVQQDLPIDAE